MNDKLLVTLMEKFDAASIVELDFSDETSRLTLRKAGAFSRSPAVPGENIPAGGTAAVPETPVRLGLPGNAGTGNAGSAGDAGSETITSPIVATFYSTPGPDAPPFVKPGTKVKAGASLCILEAMKMMNHLEAEFDCEILAVKVLNGDLVEYGQVLFEVKRL